MFFLTDEAWALAERRAMTQPISFDYWMRRGDHAADRVGRLDGRRRDAWARCLAIRGVLGADFAFTAIFIALIAAFWKGRVDRA